MDNIPELLQVERDADLVCEALVREIGRADRWIAVIGAWQALLHVRMMARGLAAEERHLCGDGRTTSRTNDQPCEEPIRG